MQRLKCAQAYLTHAPTPSGFLNLLTPYRKLPGGHYFRPHPLLGFALQSFAPYVQPYAVSDACALMTLENDPDTTTTEMQRLQTKAQNQCKPE
jgi:hypothetical protein